MNIRISVKDQTEEMLEEGIRVIEITGKESLRTEINVYTAPIFKEIILDEIEKGAIWVILETNFVAYIDSTGLGVIIGARKKIINEHEEGGIIIICSKQMYKTIFEVTGLNKIFDRAENVEEAIKMIMTGSVKSKIKVHPGSALKDDFNKLIERTNALRV